MNGHYRRSLRWNVAMAETTMARDMTLPDAPTFKHVEECYALADDHWRAWRKQAELNADYFEQGVPQREFSLKLSSDSRYAEVRSCSMRDICLNATTQMLTNDLLISVEKPTPYQRAEPSARVERDADYGEALLRAILYHAGRINTNEDPVREASINLFVTGMGAVENWYDESQAPRPLNVKRDSNRWKEWLAQRENAFPLYLDAPDPLALWPSPDDGLSWVIKRYKRRGWEIVQQYGGWRPARAAETEDWKNEEYDFFVYADDQWYLYGVWDEQEALKASPHFWGRVPIVLWASGFGRGHKPEIKYRPLCHDAIQAKYFIEEARILSQIDAINANRAWRSAIYPNTWGKIDFTPDRSNAIEAPAEDIARGYREIGGETAPPQLRDELLIVREKIEGATISSVIGTGDLPASDPTSKSIRRINEGARKLSWARQYTERGFERALGMYPAALRHPKYFGADERFILFGGQGRQAFSIPVQRERIPEHPIIRVKIDPESPQEKFSKLQAGLAMRSQRDPVTGMPVVDLFTLLEEYAGFADGGARIVHNLLVEEAIAALKPLRDQYVMGRTSGQIPPTTSLAQFVNAMGQGEQTAEQAATNGAVPPPGGPAETTDLVQELTGGFGAPGIPQGRRGFQGMRGM